MFVVFTNDANIRITILTMFIAGTVLEISMITFFCDFFLLGYQTRTETGLTCYFAIKYLSNIKSNKVRKLSKPREYKSLIYGRGIEMTIVVFYLLLSKKRGHFLSSN